MSRTKGPNPIETMLLAKYRKLEKLNKGTNQAPVDKQSKEALMRAMQKRALEREAKDKQRFFMEAKRKQLKRGRSDTETNYKKPGRQGGEAMSRATEGGKEEKGKKAKTKSVGGFDMEACMQHHMWKGLEIRQDVDLSVNQHLIQNDVGFFSVPMDQLPRVLTDDIPRMKYVWVPKEERSTQHTGTRKLLMADIEFLTKYAKSGILVIVTGVTSGFNIVLLSKLFPQVEFLLLGNRRVYLKGNEKIEIWEDENIFSDEVLEEVATKKGEKLLISDMRQNMSSAAHTGEDEADVIVKQDLRRQMDWQIRILPEASLLRFRLPWAQGKTKWFDGEIVLPVYGPQTTTECRMVVTKDTGMREFDHTQHEEQMFFFNRMMRVQYYEHGITGCATLDHCWDCAREIQILREYLTKYPDVIDLTHVKTSEEVAKQEKEAQEARERGEEPDEEEVNQNDIDIDILIQRLARFISFDLDTDGRKERQQKLPGFGRRGGKRRHGQQTAELVDYGELFGGDAEGGEDGVKPGEEEQEEEEEEEEEEEVDYGDMMFE